MTSESSTETLIFEIPYQGDIPSEITWNIKTHGEMLITANENPSDGYLWKTRKVPKCVSVVTESSSMMVSPDLLGAPSTKHTFHFKVGNCNCDKGQNTIELAAIGPGVAAQVGRTLIVKLSC